MPRKKISIKAQPETFQHVICASIPRSGHHYLENILTRYLKDKVFYCYKTDAGSCCMEVPCLRANDRLILQKTHDPFLSVNANQDRALYLIQYREPVGQLLSYVEMLDKHTKDLTRVKNKPFRSDDADFLDWWVAIHAIRMIAFLEKWMTGTRNNRIGFEYNDLIQNPDQHVRTILERMGLEFDVNRFAEVLAAVVKERAPGPTRAGKVEIYKPRDLSVSRILPAPLVLAFSEVVRSRTPFIAWPKIAIDGEASRNFIQIFEIVDALARFSRDDISTEILSQASRSPNRYVAKELDRWTKRQTPESNLQSSVPLQSLSA